MQKFKIKGNRVVSVTLDSGQNLTLQPGTYELPEQDSAVQRLLARGVFQIVEVQPQLPVVEAPAAEAKVEPASPAVEVQPQLPVVEAPAAEAAAPAVKKGASKKPLPFVPVQPQDSKESTQAEEESWEEEGGAE